MALDEAFQEAVRFHRAGQLHDAERLYRDILRSQPGHPDANHALGLIAMRVKQANRGLPYIRAALAVNPSQGQYWLSYADALTQSGQRWAARNALERARQSGLRGEAVETLKERLETSAPSAEDDSALLALFNTGQYSEAANLATTLTQRHPDYGFGWKVLGAALQETGRVSESLGSMKKAIALAPGDAETYNNLGTSLHDLGRLNDAAACHRKALQINQALAEAHFNLGGTLHDLGDLEDAATSHRRALAIKPAFAEAYFNLGRTQQILSRPDRAEAAYRRAMHVNPDYSSALNGLALLLSGQGNAAQALRAVKRSLRVNESEEAKTVFVDCVKRLRFTQCDSETYAAVLRAITEPWGRPSDLARVGIDLVKLDPAIRHALAQAAKCWPQQPAYREVVSIDVLRAASDNRLLCAVLDSAPICDYEIERLLTVARRAMLDVALEMPVSAAEVGMALRFYGALARQCFINEYIFFQTEEEIQKANELRDLMAEALASGKQVPALWPVAVAAYLPLRSLPLASRFLERRWPDEVEAVLSQQVREPAEELLLRDSIPRLTDIEDQVSLAVQNQYEENPYPRWVKMAPVWKAKSIDRYLRQTFPLASLKRHANDGEVDILIAGCGTGQHSLQTAQQFQNTKVLAIDLSITSLSYAKRRTRELGLTSIEYAQADILKLGSLGREFDLIESGGVLHHLADPWSGWRVLLSLLRPGGFMKLGFYSEVARRDIVRARAFIAERGYGSTADEIRKCRQDLMASSKNADFGAAVKSADFFSISACRDLLFHVQEHRVTLTAIDAFLRENNLMFLGFEVPTDVLYAYKLRFPDDPAAINLAYWQTFELEKPDTFFGMYQFWVQKTASVTCGQTSGAS